MGTAMTTTLAGGDCVHGEVSICAQVSGWPRGALTFMQAFSGAYPDEKFAAPAHVALAE